MTRRTVLICFWALSLVGCSNCGEPIDVVAPCDVVKSQDAALAHTTNPQGVDALKDQAFWRPGPYYTWSTSPASSCRNNPQTTATSSAPDTALMITYPTKQNPLTSGLSDIADGPWPVIVFSHANNDSVCSIFERYNTLHQHWASWGYIVISVDDTQFNCMRGNRQNIVDRSTAQLAALQSIQAWHNDPQSIFHKRVGDQVVFAGHSRGGGGSIVSWQTLTDQGGALAGIIDLQGIDVTSFGFGTPDVNVPFMGISASKDVDLDYPYVEPTEAQLKSPYTWLTIFGGIHAYTADSVPIEPDDEPGITQQQQHDVTEYYTTAFLRHIIGVGNGDASPTFVPTATDEVLFSHQGAARVKEDISEAGVAVRWNQYNANDIVIDRFNKKGGDQNPEQNALGGQNISAGLLRDEEVPTYQPDSSTPSSMYAKSYSRLLVAGNQPGEFTMTLGPDPNPGQTLGTGARFEARVKGPDEGAMPAFDIIFTTAEGEVRVDGLSLIGPLSITNRFVQLVIDLDEAGLTARPIQQVTIELKKGALFLDDPRFTVF